MEDYKVIAELTYSIVGEGTSVSRYLKHAIDKIRASKDIKIQTHPMGTVIEANTFEDIIPSGTRGS